MLYIYTKLNFNQVKESKGGLAEVKEPGVSDVFKLNSQLFNLQSLIINNQFEVRSLYEHMSSKVLERFRGIKKPP